jgi:hypothetical protein
MLGQENHVQETECGANYGTEQTTILNDASTIDDSNLPFFDVFAIKPLLDWM